MVSDFKNNNNNKPCYITYVKYVPLFFITDGKYHVLPTGELLVHDLQLNDQYPQYRCRTMHRLTRQVVGSPPVTIRISGKFCIASSLSFEGEVPPLSISGNLGFFLFFFFNSVVFFFFFKVECTNINYGNKMTFNEQTLTLTCN